MANNYVKKYSMKKRLKKYIETKEKSTYNNLDRIIEMYLNGEIKRLLSKYSGVRIYPSFYEDSKTIQLNYNFNNIYVVIDFFDNKYNVVVFHSGINLEDLEKLFIDYDYQDDFDLENLIKEVDTKIKGHPKLKDITLIKEKKRIYSLIKMINFGVSTIVWGSLALYVLITNKPVQLNVWWAILFIAVPLIVWFIFDKKLKHIK